MYSKIAFKNVKKSFKDYTIYFFTLMLAVCIFYTFNSIESQKAMSEITSSGESYVDILSKVISYVSVFIAFILGSLILYANNFLVKKRNKELGIYMTLGMSKNKISKILILETIIVGILSLISGLILGLIFSQGLSILVVKLFGLKMSTYSFVISGKAMIKTVLYFGIIFLLVMIFNSFVISKYKIIDLLTVGRKTEEVKFKSNIVYLITFILCVISLVTAYKLILEVGLLGIKDKKFLISILLGVVGTFLFFFSLSGFILYIVKKNKKIYFKGLNIFIVKQINSKVNTNFISMSVICLMLFMTIGMLSTGFSFKNAIESGLKDSTPYDASANLYIDEGEKANDIQKSLEYIGVKFNKEDKVVYYDLYTDNKTISEALNLNANMRSIMNYMKLSDYNKIRALDNQNAIELNKDEVLITSNYANTLEAIQNYVKNNDSIKIENKSYKIKDKKVIEENLKTNFMKDNMITVIVNDDICDNMTLVSSNINVNFVGEGKEKRESDFTNKIYSYKTTDTDYDKIGFVLGASRTEIYESNKGMTTIVLFIGIYIGIVFLISSMAVLALQQLSEASDSIDRYKSLKRLGASEKDINKTIFIQTLVYFSLPVILAFIHSVIGIKVANDFVSVYNKPDIMGSSLITAVIFMIVYIIYFYITYSGYKNIVKNKIHIK
ncbi:putative ABC transport system permease protein [Intestinibacter bartlettii DSM 16795]|uniref:FtsX-like permease family protein n=1 Tax=Intestinibacter bartlettii TaxID=261299 RepID=UPI000587A981|nr:ABC transporter permease [Intestinibacter bartlettii]UWO81967.1 ABC transporter permease [Intestinibacter bartlettii]SKA52708.1 putative ABC transport system permease protein [Intestinibacter bartlettii DSM 16795]